MPEDGIRALLLEEQEGKISAALFENTFMPLGSLLNSLFIHYLGII